VFVLSWCAFRTALFVDMVRVLYFVVLC